MINPTKNGLSRIMRGLGLSIAATALLSGCYSINRVELATAYSPSYVAYVSRDGSMPMDVYGNPFGNDAAANTRLISTINLAAWHGSVPARPLSAKDRADGHRLVIVFNPTNQLIDGHKVCENSRFETRPASDTMVIQAALCSHSDVISEARAEGPVAASANDAPFQGLMYRLLAVMLPAHGGSQNHQCAITPCA